MTMERAKALVKIYFDKEQKATHTQEWEVAANANAYEIHEAWQMAREKGQAWDVE